MARYGYRPRLVGMVILTMASASAAQPPAVGFDPLDCFPDLHDYLFCPTTVLEFGKLRETPH